MCWGIAFLEAAKRFVGTDAAPPEKAMAAVAIKIVTAATAIAVKYRFTENPPCLGKS